MADLSRMMGGSRPRFQPQAPKPSGPPKRDWEKASIVWKSLYSVELAYYHITTFTYNTFGRLATVSNPVLGFAWIIGTSACVFGLPLFYLTGAEIEFYKQFFSMQGMGPSAHNVVSRPYNMTFHSPLVQYTELAWFCTPRS